MSESTVIVSVKWNKKVFSDVEIDTSEPPQVFKSQLWTLTGIPPERQTVIVKGGKLKDDGDWSSFALKPNMKIMLLGTPEESVMKAPTDLPKVRDDLDVDTNDESYQSPVLTPPGLLNLGNTCYLNATIQCLNTVNPLVGSLRTYTGRTDALNPGEKVAATLRDVLRRLTARTSPEVNPLNFLRTLRQINPQFAERARNGQYIQQDAEECWREILARLTTVLKIDGLENNAAERLFALSIRGEDKCDESDEVIERQETTLSLKCHISIKVNHLSEGIWGGLDGKIEKQSDALERSAMWSRTTRIDSLPPFLVVQFLRFIWKPRDRLRVKILRRVSFPFTLDVYDFCTPRLQEKLTKKRDILPDSSSSTSDPKDSDDVLIPAETGYYSLCSVVTHRGKSAESGHYVAYGKDDSQQWHMFDDEKVTLQTDEDLKKLFGGGSWHIAYMCVYKAKNHSQ